jgi:hypothetical protein
LGVIGEKEGGERWSGVQQMDENMIYNENDLEILKGGGGGGVGGMWGRGRGRVKGSRGGGGDEEEGKEEAVGGKTAVSSSSPSSSVSRSVQYKRFNSFPIILYLSFMISSFLLLLFITL